MFVRHDAFVKAGLRHPFAAPLPSDCLEDANAGAGRHRGVRLLEAAVRDALCDSMGRPELAGLGVPADRIGLFVGTSSAGIGGLSAALAGDGGRDSEARYAWESERVARTLGVRGPVQVTCSVCAAGAQAIAEAASWLRHQVVDVAIAVGYDVLEPFVGAGFTALGAYADKPMPFRASRRGLVLGEAGAALILTRRGQPGFDTKGTLDGWGSAGDAFHLTAPHPDGLGLATASRAALVHAGRKPSEIDAINAHGTSTLYNDRMEARAFTNVFGPRAGERPVYTVKGTIGHTLGAAGAVEAVVSLVSMQRKVIPPTVTSGDLDPECDVDLVTEPRSTPLRHTLSVSAGFGGVNCVLVFGGIG
jgi:3-oxoacyl-[acyl-carrier-protein] synthase II